MALIHFKIHIPISLRTPPKNTWGSRLTRDVSRFKVNALQRSLEAKRANSVPSVRPKLLLETLLLLKHICFQSPVTINAFHHICSELQAVTEMFIVNILVVKWKITQIISYRFCGQIWQVKERNDKNITIWKQKWHHRQSNRQSVKFQRLSKFFPRIPQLNTQLLKTCY